MLTWVDALTKEYNAGIRELERYRHSLDQELIAGQMEHETVSEMISEMNMSLNWIRSGVRPGTHRGASQQGIYQRTELAKEFPGIMAGVAGITIEDRKRVVDLLMCFSVRERQCFLLNTVGLLTQEEIAGKLCITRTSVQKFLQRAKSKAEQRGF